MIGGKVAQNIEGGFWANTCAVRISYILNYSGLAIPRTSGKTVSGEDGKYYFFRVRDVIAFLERQWGKADKEIDNPSSADLDGLKGLVIFEVSGWSDAQGHVTLWDGSRCYDNCYFSQAKRVYFWSLL